MKIPSTFAKAIDAATSAGFVNVVNTCIDKAKKFPEGSKKIVERLEALDKKMADNHKTTSSNLEALQKQHEVLVRLQQEDRDTLNKILQAQSSPAKEKTPRAFSPKNGIR